jgi:hypothetical protein
MKYTLFNLLLIVLPFNLIGQNQTDTLKKTSPPIMLNKNEDLKKVSMNLINAGKSYETSDNLFLLGALTSVIGAIVLNKQSSGGLKTGVVKDNSTGKFLIGIGVGLNIIGIFYRYDGHSELKAGGKNIENYHNSLK